MIYVYQSILHFHPYPNTTKDVLILPFFPSSPFLVLSFLPLHSPFFFLNLFSLLSFFDLTLDLKIVIDIELFTLFPYPTLFRSTLPLVSLSYCFVLSGLLY